MRRRGEFGRHPPVRGGGNIAAQTGPSAVVVSAGWNETNPLPRHTYKVGIISVRRESFIRVRHIALVEVRRKVVKSSVWRGTFGQYIESRAPGSATSLTMRFPYQSYPLY